MNPTLRQTIQTKNLIVGLENEFIYKVENISTDISLLSQPSELYKMLLPVIHLYSGKEEALYQALTYLRSTPFL